MAQQRRILAASQHRHREPSWGKRDRSLVIPWTPFSTAGGRATRWRCAGRRRMWAGGGRAGGHRIA